MQLTILRYDTIDSTNTEALRQARLGAAEGLVILAAEQTGGRGRLGRTWVSTKDAGLYFSVILRPRFEIQYFPLITLMAGVSVHEAIEGFGLNPDLKWVNDVLVGGKKISGILAEATETPSGTAVIVGIGVNLRSFGYPPEIVGTATSIEHELGTVLDAEAVLEHLTKRMIKNWNTLNLSDGPEQIRQNWTNRSSYAYGKRVVAVTDEGKVNGTTNGIESDGALRITLDDGTIRVIRAGDVEMVRAA
ncbi:MAG: biotin--[acetyl-CoA-carboxylase] ligase [Pyrinomonadaceae bacterium]